MLLPADCPHRSFRFLRVTMMLCLLVVTASCAGYTLEADSPSIFGTGEKTLKVKSVDYPTLHPWLPYAIRSALRDELNNRHIVKWVDSGPADYEIRIKVISYTMRDWMRNVADKTVLFDSTLTLEATVFDGSTNKEVWRSGPLYYSDHLEKPNEQIAANDLITQIVRQLADKMRDAF